MPKKQKDPSLLLSQSCLLVLALLLLGLDVGGYWIAKWFLLVSHGLEGKWDGILLLTSLYTCSIPAWIAIAALWRLLSGIARGGIFFSKASVRCLHTTAICCFTVCLLTLASAIYYRPMALLALVAAFIGAIVRTVMTAFQRALSMQDELDFTV